MPHGNEQLNKVGVNNKSPHTAASSKPHLLIYAHYYSPDKASTGQIIQDLAEGMLDTFKVTVFCVVPSYLGVIEDKWKTQKYYKENINGVDVVRVSVPEFTKSSKKSRVKNIVAYFFRAMKATGMVGRVDYVMSVSQPPILGGLFGVWGKLTKRGSRFRNLIYNNEEKVQNCGIEDGLTGEVAAEMAGVSDKGSGSPRPKYTYHIQDYFIRQVAA